MLDELAVRNLAILEDARIQPGPGLTVLTGETGAGKTLLLGALGILYGADLMAERIGPFSEEATIEARFVDADGVELIVGKKRGKGGRTRSYLDGDMAAAPRLAESLVGRLEMVAQHDHLRIARKDEVLRILDGLLDEAGLEIRGRYGSLWDEWLRLGRQAAELGGDRRALERERDLLAHESREIAAAGLTDVEVDDLRSTASRLRHAQDLIELLGTAAGALEVADEAVAAASAATRRAADLSSDLSDLAATVEGISLELREAARHTGTELRGTMLDPTELHRVEQRLAMLGDLRRKYGDTVPEINAYGERVGRRAAELAETLDLADRIEGELERLRAALVEVGALLTVARTVAATKLCKEAESHLRDLGFSAPRLVIGFEELLSPSSGGTSTAVLLFSSDGSLAPGPVSGVASGGELSRLVLALRLAAGLGDVDVVAFDEVDAGVGGTTALRVGEKLADLAARTQVMCVTHLPQIAAFADTHYTIERLEGKARVRRVEGQARLAELTRMLSGIESTDSGLGHAEELVAYANRHRPGL